jgi:hypothetical protein
MSLPGAGGKLSTKNGINVYITDFMMAPIGLECSLNRCTYNCAYCFANLTYPERHADLPQIMGLLSDFQNRKTREAVFLQQGYPMLLSNRVDPFAGPNADITEAIWEVCMEVGIPLTWQTRGAHKAQKKILDRIIDESPPQVWYLSIPIMDDAVAKNLEPGAPSPSSRLELITQLREAGHEVVIGAIPTHADWLPQPELLCDAIKERDAWGIWTMPLHLDAGYLRNMPERDRIAIGEDAIREAGLKGSDVDFLVSEQATQYAKEIGLQVYGVGVQGATDFWTPFEHLYDNVMPYWQQVLNVADDSLGDDDDPDAYVVITRGDAEELLSPIPDINWAENFQLRSAKRLWEAMTGRPAEERQPGDKMPRVGSKECMDLIWNNRFFGRRYGLAGRDSCAMAVVMEGNEYTPIVDENGDRLFAYRRRGWPYGIAHLPELAA